MFLKNRVLEYQTKLKRGSMKMLDILSLIDDVLSECLGSKTHTSRGRLLVLC